MNKIVRHGDVNFIPCEIPKGAVLVEETNHKVVAYGEATGHNHTLTSPTLFKIYEFNGNRYYDMQDKGEFDHPEHGIRPVLNISYKHIREREKDWFSLTVRKVVD